MIIFNRAKITYLQKHSQQAYLQSKKIFEDEKNSINVIIEINTIYFDKIIRNKLKKMFRKCKIIYYKMRDW